MSVDSRKVENEHIEELIKGMMEEMAGIRAELYPTKRARNWDNMRANAILLQEHSTVLNTILKAKT